MAKQPSAFDLKHIEENAASEMSGVLDQLNLPPGLIDFLRKNQRTIWIFFGVVATVVTVVSLYGSYRNYTANKAAKAYDQALLLDGDQKKAALEQVAEAYSSTPTAVWSKVDLAHLDQEAGNVKAAIDKLIAVNSGLRATSLLKPLVLVNLGGLYEQDKQLDQAAATYQELKTLQGFEAAAVQSLGRVAEAKGEKEKAMGLYNEYLTLTTAEGTAPQRDDPARTMVRAALNRLQQ